MGVWARILLLPAVLLMIVAYLGVSMVSAVIAWWERRHDWQVP